jgi:tRNA nucleotidyltransferase (CCA-adding enzyme)
MKEALDVVMAWQLRNPDSTNAAAAIEAVKASRNKQTDSELPFRLASHFLQLTIPPFFPQNKAATDALETSRQPAPWKDPGAHYIFDLLAWSIQSMGPKEIEARWHLLVPPILKMIDEIDAGWKAKGCQYLGLLLGSLRLSTTSNIAQQRVKSKLTLSEFLRRTGYHNVFADSLFPLFTYIPSLTPETEAVPLFQELFPALTALSIFLPKEAWKGAMQEQFLDRMLREGVLSPLAHFPTPSTYPELSTVIVTYLQIILGHLGIASVKHLPHLVPLLSAILQEPFIITHRALTVSTLKALQTLTLNAWPRIPAYRGAIMMGLCLCWARCVEDSKSEDGQSHVGEVKELVQETTAILDAVMQAAEKKGAWEQEKQEVVEASLLHEGMFDGCRVVDA